MATAFWSLIWVFFACGLIFTAACAVAHGWEWWKARTDPGYMAPWAHREPGDLP